jgi:hypothetical protein
MAHVLNAVPRPDGVETQGAQFFTANQLRTLPLSEHARTYLAAEQSHTQETYFAPSNWRPGAA